MPSRFGLSLAVLAALCIPLVGADENAFQGVARVVAVGDLHGDYDATVEVFRLAGVIDGKNKWTGGKTHLVQMGDVPDRAPDTRKIIELLMNLEKQAKKAGGAVHVLIGNHEAMNVYGDLRYTTREEFGAFKTSSSGEVRDAYYQRLIEQDKPADVGAFRKKFDEEVPLGWVEQRQAWSSKGEIGKWVFGHNAVIKINDSLFVHGGISPRVASMTLDDMNKTIIDELTNPEKLQGGLAMADDGPLWYRGLASGPEEKVVAEMDVVSKNFGIARIVLGHTPTKAPIKPRANGRVIVVDTGLSRAYGGPKDCLIIEGEKLFSMSGGTKTPLN